MEKLKVVVETVYSWKQAVAEGVDIADQARMDEESFKADPDVFWEWFLDQDDFKISVEVVDE